ncbi:exostosin-like 2 isoform X2 [Arachis ipaensis]|uniref:exostosin-like 2 isoform X2 n=1 Tax=Arachis ipaensis TaxID=130454 RepID=UPI000A2B0BA5|nr:exostosin-like 2 isoform X2 [Arachis ipaensis]
MSSVHVDIAGDAAAAATDGFYSPAKQKAANRRPTVLTIQRARQTLCAAKVKLILAVLTFSFIIYVSSKLSSFMGWNPHYPSFVSSPSRGGYTVLINSWKQSSVLKQSVAHYASCRSVERIHVSWSGSEPPSEKLIARLNEIVVLKSEGAQKTDFIFEVISGDQLASRFRPKSYPNTDAIFSVDDNVIVPCPSLDFAFSVWQTAPLSMVGFVPRTHSVNKEDGGQFGGRELIPWFSQRLHSFTGNTWTFMLICLRRFRTMLLTRGVVKTSQCPSSSLMLQVLLRYGSKVAFLSFSFKQLQIFNHRQNL